MRVGSPDIQVPCTPSVPLIRLFDNKNLNGCTHPELQPLLSPQFSQPESGGTGSLDTSITIEASSTPCFPIVLASSEMRLSLLARFVFPLFLTENLEVSKKRLIFAASKTNKKDIMSTAELTAHRIFDSYRFQGLPDDVKRHLAILCLSATSSATDIAVEDSLLLTSSEKKMRATSALMDAKSGNSYSTEEVCKKLDSKYPWLCK